MTAFFCLLYFVVGVVPRAMQPAVYESRFDTDGGAFARLYASQTLDSLLVALCVQAALVALSGGTIQVLLTLPLFVAWGLYKKRSKNRHDASVHGASKSRLPLLEASTVDADRGTHLDAVETKLHDDDKFWQAPEALPADLVDADAPAKKQLDGLDLWLHRHRAAAAAAWPRETAARVPDDDDKRA